MILDLNGKWNMRPLQGGDWIPAEVPGSLYEDLLREGLLKDPFYRAQEDEALAPALNDYEYAKDFQVKDELLCCDQVLLVAEGLNTLAEISLNGKRLASTNNMHRKYEWNIKEGLKPGFNQLRIIFRSSYTYIEEQQKQRPIWGQFHTHPGFPHLRNAHYLFGWDWGPLLPDMGIWRSIAIKGYNDMKIEEAHIQQTHENGQVTLHGKLDIENLNRQITSKAEIQAELTHPDGSVERFAFAAVEATKISIDIQSPQLWWPNDYGEQPLYQLQFSLYVDGKELDRHRLQLGLRTIRLRREKDQWGESFYFEVNGVPVFIKGANYIPEDNLTGRYDEAKTERLLQDSAGSHFNMIRVWGGGIYPPDSFYELCDRYGLLVWQDFMFACANYELTEEMENTVKAEAEDQIKRLRHHACLALWCGNNEIEMAWVDWDIPEDNKLRSDHTRLFEQLLPRQVETHDPQTDYWPSSPSSGGGFDKPNDEHRGDAHYWDVWHGLKPFSDYQKYYFRFVSEFGFQSFPELKTVKSYTEPEDRNIFSYVMEKHQKNEAANGKILYYLSENFLYPKDFESLLYVSQLLQAEAIKYGVEHWRRHRGRCMGALYWQLNDCWPVASWASIDYYGRWKALHYFARKFYKPVLLSAELSDATKVRLVLSNDRMEAVEGKVQWSLRDAKGKVVTSGELDARAGALSAETVETLELKPHLQQNGDDRKYHFHFQWAGDDGEKVEETLLFCPAKHYLWEEPGLSWTVEEGDDQYLIHLQAQSYTAYVELRLREADVVFSDNYFDMADEYTVSVAKSQLTMGFGLEEMKKQLQVRSLWDSF